MDIINELFKANKDNPPLNKPPVAGSIKWARSLLYRIKHTILPFLDLPEMLESEQGKVVRLFLLLHCDIHIKNVIETLYVTFAAFCSGQGQVCASGITVQAL